MLVHSTGGIFSDAIVLSVLGVACWMVDDVLVLPLFYFLEAGGLTVGLESDMCSSSEHGHCLMLTHVA